jgi:hypothetical protein
MVQIVIMLTAHLVVHIPIAAAAAAKLLVAIAITAAGTSPVLRKFIMQAPRITVHREEVCRVLLVM